jgi:hypothetical protein
MLQKKNGEQEYDREVERDETDYDEVMSGQLERRPSTLGLDHACVCIANGKTLRAPSVAF